MTLLLVALLSSPPVVALFSPQPSLRWEAKALPGHELTLRAAPPAEAPSHFERAVGELTVRAQELGTPRAGRPMVLPALGRGAIGATLRLDF